MDISEKVLAAFSAEHKEFLEGIRSLLAELEQANAAAGDPRFDEVYRMAHSLKGGARVCDLRPVETLGHRLEEAFERIRQGELKLDTDVTVKVNCVLDAIEDWMSSLSLGEEPAEPSEALEVIEQLLGRPGEDGKPAAPEQKPSTRQSRLIEAFQREYKSCLDSLRQMLFPKNEDGSASENTTPDFEEMFRIVHCLHTAASVAGQEAVAKIGEKWETLVNNLRGGAVEWNSRTVEIIELAMAAVEDEMQGLPHTGMPDESPSVLRSIDELLGIRQPDAIGSESADGAPNEQNSSGTPENLKRNNTSATHAPMDTVRVSTDGLNRLLRSTGQLLSNTLGQNRVATQLTEMKELVAELDREREYVRKHATAQIHRLGNMPEFARLTRFFDIAERRIHDLSRKARHIELLHKKSSWSLRSLGQEVQRDVRQARMVPVESIFQGFRKMVRDLARDESKEIQFRMSGLDVPADRMVLQALKDPVMHMLRNAVSHGAESANERQQAGKPTATVIDLRIETVGNLLKIIIEDDGRGINLKRVRETALNRGLISEAEASERSPEEIAMLIFKPGFSTSEVITEISGRGMGLSVVHETVTRLQGEIRLPQVEGPGTVIEISVPVSISTHRLLLVECDDQTFALPLHGIRRLIRRKTSDLQTVEGRPLVNFEGRPIPLIRLGTMLGIRVDSTSTANEALSIAILRSGPSHIAVEVDRFLAEADALVQDLSGPARKLKTFSGAVLQEDGNPVLVLNVGQLIESGDLDQRHARIETGDREAEVKTKTVLIVDDSFTTRTLEKSILEAHGYDVSIAVDGEEALSKLQLGRVDLVISDVEMPRMDGFTLVECMKNDNQLSDIPVILVTSLNRREDQERGLSLGADAYIVKQKFDHEDLMATVRQLV